MDQIKQQLDQLSDLDDSQIEGLQEGILSEFDTVSESDPTPETVDAMTSLADMLDTVREEVNRRAAQAEELSARAAEASARVRGSEEPAAETATDEAPTDSDADTDASAPVDAKEPVAASAAEEETTPTEDATVETSETPAELSVEEVPAIDEAPAESEVVEPSDAEPAEAATETPAEAEASVEETPAETTPEENTEFSTEAQATPADEATNETELSVEETSAAVVETPEEADASTIEDTIEQTAQEEAPVTAAADEGNFAPADRRPVDQGNATVPVAITAGADIPGVTAGSPVDNMLEVAELMERRLGTLRRITSGGDGEQYIVASLGTEYPESRHLGMDMERNTQKIDDVVGAKALAASGGFAAPLEASYDLYPVPATDARPVRDSLPRFQADRGGVRYLKAPGLSSYQQAVGVWTNQNDIDAATNTSLRKNVLIVGGVQENVAYTDAITLQLQFGNFMTRAFPELIARHNELALIQHARVAEINLLSKINAASLQVTAGGKIGFARDLIVQIKRAAASYRSRNRMASNGQLRAIVPAWILDAAAADLVLQMPGDDTLGTSAATVNGYLAGSSITITASLDQNVFGAQNAGALLEFPDTFTWFLFPEGSFVFLDGGELNIGIVRDSGLVGSNDYRMFTETFEGLAFIGDESLAITSQLNVNGTAAALIDTVGAGTASATDF
jgi:hypothetical protein